MSEDHATNPDLPFEALDPVYRRFIDDCLALYGLDPARFCRPLPGRDEMFFKAILPNYEGDASIAAYKFVEATMRHYEAHRQIVDGQFGGYGKVGSVLDFASGWGRLTRVLEQRLKPGQIYVSDIYGDAVAWQAETFGIHAFPSTPDPKALKPGRARHDLIFVGSMFSHLPDGLFRAWLKTLHGLLSPRGVLAFSVHDESFLPAQEPRDPSGISYFRFSESGSLDLDIYGMSYVTEAYVAGAIGQLGGKLFRGKPQWRRFPKALYENQDLYVVGAPGVDLSALSVAAPPLGGFETATLLPTGEVEWSGWALERTPGAAISEVVAYVDGRPAAATAPGAERPDVAQHFPGAANPAEGWRLRLAAPAGALLRLQLKSSTGLSGYLHAEVPSGGALTYAGWSRRALRP